MITDKNNIKSIFLAITAGIFAGFINGFLGAGGGILLLWVLNHLNKDKTSAGARNNFAAVVAVVLLLSIVSAVSYSHHSNIDTSYLVILAIPGACGGVLGAYLTDRLNTNILKLVFCLIMVIAGINMIR